MKQGTIATAPIQYFPLDALYLSDMNPRQDVDADRIDQLADSIVAVGLLQNLAGLADEAGNVGIVAGGRRLRALIRAFEKHADLLDRRPELAEIPVRLAPDAATARAWASVENAAPRICTPPMKSAPMAGWPRRAAMCLPSPACSP